MRRLFAFCMVSLFVVVLWTMLLPDLRAGDVAMMDSGMRAAVAYLGPLTVAACCMAARKTR